MINLIDTVKLKYSFQNEEQFHNLVNWLDDNYPETFQSIVKSSGLVTYTCFVKNMRISINSHYVFIEGSIHKLFLGNNVYEMSLSDTYNSFDLLNELLGNIINVKRAYVKRLDFGCNISMQNNPDSYISKLYAITSTKFNHYNNQTIDFRNGSRGMIIYNKTVEARKSMKKTIIKDVLPDHLLRLEVSFKRKEIFEKNFGSKLPTVQQILDQMNMLPDIWYSEYKKIGKEYSSDIDCIRNKKDLFNYAINIAGIKKCKYIIDYSYSLNLINKQDRYRYTKSITAAFQKPTIKQNNDLMIELDQKIELSYKRLKGIV